MHTNTRPKMFESKTPFAWCTLSLDTLLFHCAKNKNLYVFLLLISQHSHMFRSAWEPKLIIKNMWCFEKSSIFQYFGTDPSWQLFTNWQFMTQSGIHFKLSDFWVLHFMVSHRRCAFFRITLQLLCPALCEFQPWSVDSQIHSMCTLNSFYIWTEFQVWVTFLTSDSKREMLFWSDLPKTTINTMLPTASENHLKSRNKDWVDELNSSEIEC